MNTDAARREVEALREHERSLVAFGEFMVNANPKDPRSVDYWQMGKLAAEVINGIAAVRAAILDRPAPLSEVERLVNEQAEDEGLWFIAGTAPEAYLQQELRRLHAAIERAALHPAEGSAETP